jgi:hypothetical protein
MVDVRKRCYHIDFFVDLMALSLVLCKITKLDIRGPPPVPCYAVARGRLLRREYWSRKLPSTFFSQPLRSFRFFDRALPFRIQAGQLRPVHISLEKTGTLRTHMNNQLHVFHHNTLIVHNSTSHLAQNRIESRGRRTVMNESHSKETARPRDKPL